MSQILTSYNTYNHTHSFHIFLDNTPLTPSYTKEHSGAALLTITGGVIRDWSLPLRVEDGSAGRLAAPATPAAAHSAVSAAFTAAVDAAIA